MLQINMNWGGKTPKIIRKMQKYYDFYRRLYILKVNIVIRR